MSYAAVAVVVMLLCVGAGARGSAALRPLVAALFALALVAAQLALLMS